MAKKNSTLLGMPGTASPMSRSMPAILNRRRAKFSASKENYSTDDDDDRCNTSETDTARSRSPLTNVQQNFSSSTSIISPPSSGSEKALKRPAATKRKLMLRDSWRQFRQCSPDSPSAKKRSVETSFVLKNRKSYVRCSAAQVLQLHPALQPRMRTILLDWLIEVCAVYRLNRESFHLAADFFDRYMSSVLNMPKTKLQLIGVTCLFIAAKIEEIYPPKLTEFSYVTDGACSENEILHTELVILKELQWSLSPLTTNAWVKQLLQLDTLDQRTEPSARAIERSITAPTYSAVAYAKVMHLVDLSIIDISSLDFAYSSIAFSAISFVAGFTGPPNSLVAELDEAEISACMRWMAAHARVAGQVNHAEAGAGRSDDDNILQIHSVDVNMLDIVLQHQAQLQPEPISREDDDDDDAAVGHSNDDEDDDEDIDEDIDEDQVDDDEDDDDENDEVDMNVVIDEDH